MRGDWMYDWVRVEMDYRAGSRPVSPRRPDRKPARHRRALWTGLFAAQRRVGVPHGSSVS